jgi:trans-aconitate 2-methyltransferase
MKSRGPGTKIDVRTRARGLAAVARTFAPTSRTFLAGARRPHVDLALDLGCGPGHTTRLIAETLAPHRLVGLDQFAPFLRLARSRLGAKAVFAQFDVTSESFPTWTPDLVYCRFLVGHLPRPQAQVTRWGGQLRRGGLLLLEEVEWIRPENPVFGTFVDMVDAMLDEKQVPYAGPMIDTVPESPELRRSLSQIAVLSPPSAQVARMFWLNLPAWRHDPFIRERYPVHTVPDLERNLETLWRSRRRSEISWGLRQVVFERR